MKKEILDGWAYDIGFAGLDHMLASGEPVKTVAEYVCNSDRYADYMTDPTEAGILGPELQADCNRQVDALRNPAKEK